MGHPSRSRFIQGRYQVPQTLIRRLRCAGLLQEAPTFTLLQRRCLVLSDPQSITINAAPFSLPKVSVDGSQSTYRSADGQFEMKVSHAYGKRTRRVLSLTWFKTSADPYIPSQNARSNLRVYAVIDTPTHGFAPAEVTELLNALRTELQESGTKLIGGES